MGGLADRYYGRVPTLAERYQSQRSGETWGRIGHAALKGTEYALRTTLTGMIGPAALLFAPKKSITSRLFQGISLGVAAPQAYAQQSEQGTVMNRQEAYEQPSYPEIQKFQNIPVLGWMPGLREKSMQYGMIREMYDVARGRQKLTEGPTARTLDQLLRTSRAGEFLPTSPQKRSERGEPTWRAWTLGIVEDFVADPVTYFSAGPKSVYSKAAQELEKVLPSLSRELVAGVLVPRRAAAVAPQEVEGLVGYWARRGFESAFEGARPERMAQLVGEKAGRYAPVPRLAERIQMQVAQKRLSRAFGTQTVEQLMADASRVGNRAGRESMQTYWKIGIPFLEQQAGLNVKPTGEWRAAAMEAIQRRAPRAVESLQFARRKVSTAIPGEPMVSDILRQAKTGVTQQTQDLGTTLAKAGAQQQNAETRVMEFHHVYRRNQPVEALIQEVDAIRAQNLAPQTKAAYLRSHYMLPSESFDEADQVASLLFQGAKADADPEALRGFGQKYADAYLEARSKLGGQVKAQELAQQKAEQAQGITNDIYNRIYNENVMTGADPHRAQMLAQRQMANDPNIAAQIAQAQRDAQEAAAAVGQAADEGAIQQGLRTAVWSDLKRDMADSYLRVSALAQFPDAAPIQRALQNKMFPQDLSLAGKEVWQQLRKLPAENIRTAILEGSSLGFTKRTDYVSALRQLTREHEPAIRQITRVTKLGEELLNGWGLQSQEKGLIDNMLEGYMASIREGSSYQLERQWKDWAKKTLQEKYGTVNEDALDRVAFMVREAPKADNLSLRLLQDVDDGVVKDLEASYMRTLVESGGVNEMPGFRLPGTTEEARHIISGMGPRQPGFSKQQVMGPLNALRAGFSTVIDYPQMVRTRGIMQFAAIERQKLGQFGMLWGVPRSMMLENPSKYRGFITLEDYARKVKASGAQIGRVWPELSSAVDPLVFPEDIAHHLVAARVLSLDDPGMTWVKRGYMTMLRSYKAGATISRPAWASVNVQGAVVNNVIQGVTNPARYYTGAALVGGPVGDFFARQASIFDRGVMKVRNGAFFLHTPAGDIPLEQARRLVEQKGILAGWTKDVMADLPPQKMGKLLEGLNRELNPLSPDFWMYYPVKTAGAWSESVTKTTLFADRLAKGHHPNMAARAVVDTHFDYSDLTDAERAARTYVWPFFAWLKKNAAYQLKALAEHPKLAVLAPQMLIGLEQAGPQEDRVPKAELPDWLQNDMTIQVPNLKTESGDPIFVTFRLPIMDLNRIFSIRQILSSVGVAKLIPELVLNKSFYTGRAIDTKKDYYQGAARDVMHDWVEAPWWIALAPDMFIPTGHVKITEPDENGKRHVLITAQLKYGIESTVPLSGTATRYGALSEPDQTGENIVRIGRFRGNIKWVNPLTGISMRSFNRQKLHERFLQEQKDVERAQHKQGVQLGTEPPTLREYEESQRK